MLAILSGLQLVSLSTTAAIPFPAELHNWHFSDLASNDVVAIVRPVGKPGLSSVAAERGIERFAESLETQRFAIVDSIGWNGKKRLTSAVPSHRKDGLTGIKLQLDGLDPSRTYLLVARAPIGGRLEFRDSGAETARPLLAPVTAASPDRDDVAGFFLIPTKAKKLDKSTTPLQAALEAYGDAVATADDRSCFRLSAVWEHLCIEDLLKNFKIDGTEAGEWMRTNFAPQVIAGFSKMQPLAKLAAVRMLRYIELPVWNDEVRKAYDGYLVRRTSKSDLRAAALIQDLHIEGALGGADQLVGDIVTAPSDVLRVALLSNFDRAPNPDGQRILVSLVDKVGPEARFAIYDNLADWHDDASHKPKAQMEGRFMQIVDEPALRLYWRSNLESSGTSSGGS